jgi:hypothetical protein
LDILQARVIIAKTHTAPCIAGGSNWHITKHGAQALCIGEVLSGARPIMSHDPDQDPQQFTMHELLGCLDLQEWSMQEHAGRGRSRRTIPEPFSHASERVFYVTRHEDSYRAPRLYLVALVLADRPGSTMKTLQHLRPPTYYACLLAPSARR